MCVCVCVCARARVQDVCVCVCVYLPVTKFNLLIKIDINAHAGTQFLVDCIPLI